LDVIYLICGLLQRGINYAIKYYQNCKKLIMYNDDPYLFGVLEMNTLPYVYFLLLWIH
jgi:hypothetical protein